MKYHLEQLVHFAKQYDSLDGEYTYTSTIMNGVKEDSRKFYTNAEGTGCEQYLEALTDENSRMFDKYRETEWFKDVISNLSI